MKIDKDMNIFSQISRKREITSNILSILIAFFYPFTIIIILYLDHPLYNFYSNNKATFFIIYLFSVLLFNTIKELLILPTIYNKKLKKALLNELSEYMLKNNIKIKEKNKDRITFWADDLSYEALRNVDEYILYHAYNNRIENSVYYYRDDQYIKLY